MTVGEFILMNNIRFLFAVVQLTLLSGCVTFGNLKEDIVELNRDFKPTISSKTLYIDFKSLPGLVSATSYAQFTEVTSTFDGTPIAKDMANAVFKIKFAKVVNGKPPTNLSGPYYQLLVDAKAEASAIDGSHTAILNTKLLDQNSVLLVKSEANQVVNAVFFARKKPMTRAFYRAFHDIFIHINLYIL